MRDLGIRWLLDRIGDNGEPAFANQHNGYYRLPWTLAFAGQREAGACVLDWIEKFTLTAEGDLQPGPPRAAWTRVAATYPLTIIAHGAWVLERYGTATTVFDTVRQLQDPESGGAYWERPEARTDGRQLLFPTAQLGLTALTMGHIGVAEHVYSWFKALLASQPELPSRFYVGWTSNGLVTDVPDSDRYNLVVDFSAPRQAFHNPGIAAAFLARYADRTGTTSASDAARDLLRLYDGATPQLFNYRESTGVCKLGFGSSMLLEAVPEHFLVNNILRMTQWYRESQTPQGAWMPRTFLRPDPQEWHAIEKTAEHVLWVSMMLVALHTYERFAHEETTA
ncbi:hypothetical protein [Rhodococcus rhodochrous]|uniref:Uncharacterized protein n=1 Tax=Rhodococcus rhodochrous TaxID=1829 RepID=A0AA46X1I5_RHORH|nr:hypothetical protein [Rhodococcus rhodochrous]MCB8913955.1 hypothetical protein [Rhodococcus rhodochrous]UZF48330.1 hypothetical protein KUM34_028775 [Rhodococcus rhodochrous]